MHLQPGNRKTWAPSTAAASASPRTRLASAMAEEVPVPVVLTTRAGMHRAAGGPLPAAAKSLLGAPVGAGARGDATASDRE